MLYITYSLLGIYVLPLLFILFSLYSTDFYSLQNNTVYVADAVSGNFFSLFRDTFGSIIVPLVTAYSLPDRQPNSPVPKQTLALFFTLAGFFLLVVILYGVIKYYEIPLQKFNVADDAGKIIKDVPKVFFDTILAYAKETLAYIALILGISLKK